MMRPKLEGITEERVKLFLERGIFKTQAEVLFAAMELLIEHQLEEDSKSWNESSTPDEHVMAQVG